MRVTLQAHVEVMHPIEHLTGFVQEGFVAVSVLAQQDDVLFAFTVVLSGQDEACQQARQSVDVEDDSLGHVWKRGWEAWEEAQKQLFSTPRGLGPRKKDEKWHFRDHLGAAEPHRKRAFSQSGGSHRRCPRLGHRELNLRLLLLTQCPASNCVQDLAGDVNPCEILHPSP